MTNYPPSLPSFLLVVSTVVSLVTGSGTGSTVHVIFSSHIDSQSLSFLPLPVFFPLLTAGPFLPLLVVDTVEMCLMNSALQV